MGDMGQVLEGPLGSVLFGMCAGSLGGILHYVGNPWGQAVLVGGILIGAGLQLRGGRA